MITINGAQGEGGGQVLRTSLTLSALTGKPVHIHHIRAKRSKPGLQPQHLAAVKAIARLTDADLTGAQLNSSELTLTPRKLRPGRYRFEIPTAGALTLVLQTVFLPLSLTPGSSQITLSGGTHVPWSPTYHYLSEHWLPQLDICGFRAEFKLIHAGFYPQGGGQVQGRILPIQETSPLVGLQRGDLSHIRGLSGVANLQDEIAQRQKHQALQQLYPLCKDSKIKTLRLPSPGKGTFVLLRASFSNGGQACFTALGAPGKPAEQVAYEAVTHLLAFLDTDGFFDHHLSDQLLLPLLAVQGESAFRTSRVTQHLLTNAEVIEQFLPGQVSIEGMLGSPGLVQVRGDTQFQLG